MNRFFFTLAALITLVIIQTSFLPTWPSPVRNVNLVLCLVVFITVVVNYRDGLWWAVGAGLLLDFFSPRIFGLTALGLLLVVWVVNFLFTHLFTNRSFYSVLLLGIAGTLTQVTVTILSIVIAAAGERTALPLMIDAAYGWYIFWQLILNALVMSIIFILFHFLTDRLRTNIVPN